MNLFEQHEIFEMEVLERMKSSRLLEKLIFGGGTMLRLCHELPRYSADLDFWKWKPFDDEQFLHRLRQSLGRSYEITDAELKRFTILLELRSARYPRRLKIEIRREMQDWDVEDQIAFSPYSPRQVLLKAHTLKQTLQNKIAALLERGEIRDAFDIEFILRRGVALPPLEPEVVDKLLARLRGFSPQDFRVTLGSVLQPEWREYYQTNGFQFLMEKLNAQR
ncbi:MAG: nucleotidyl transferase AbiEii/AbiGii toxin family protein [Calditrichaeota bacterium]|nr:nucleotidyl transferase AbiEii/AbiGii toxin family protein [Calditrichota bacterium]